MISSEILESGEGADRGGDEVIGNQQKCPDDRDDFGAMTNACINATAIRVKPADDHVVDPDERRQDAHRGDQPKRGVTADGERQPNDVRFARSPVAVENRRRPRNVDVARTFNVGCDHITDGWVRTTRFPFRAAGSRAAAARILDEPRPEWRSDLLRLGGRGQARFRVIRTSARGQKIGNLFCQPLAVACGHNDKHDCVHTQTLVQADVGPLIKICLRNAKRSLRPPPTPHSFSADNR